MGEVQAAYEQHKNETLVYSCWFGRIVLYAVSLKFLLNENSGKLDMSHCLDTL